MTSLEKALRLFGHVAKLRIQDNATVLTPSSMTTCISTKAYRASVHSELHELYSNDQGDRRAENPDWTQLTERDRKRRERVLELVEAGEPKVADDFFHAAMVLQHGNAPEHFKMAHDLARRAAELDPGHRTAKWLSAAAWDRYLWNTDQPQIYGTQFRKDRGLWRLEPFDREAVSDEDRQALNVPVLAETLKRLKRMNAALDAEETAATQDRKANLKELTKEIDERKARGEENLCWYSVKQRAASLEASNGRVFWELEDGREVEVTEVGGCDFDDAVRLGIGSHFLRRE